MRLNINKACDLSSISVFPPPSRRRSSGVDPAAFGKIQPSQLRSQSQQSFSQGMSLSQLSQNSFDEAPTNEQRFGSQERDQPVKKICSLPPTTVSRDDSQLVTRSSNIIPRWSSSAPERRCQIGEEFEHRFGLMESNLSRFGRMLDSIQSDVMQINRAVKEVMLEMESIKQKTVAHDNSLQLVVKAEEDIKASIDRSFKSCFEMKSEPDKNSLQKIFTLLSTLTDQVEFRMSTLHKEIHGIISKEMEAVSGSWRPSRSVQSPRALTSMAVRDSWRPSSSVQSPRVHTSMKRSNESIRHENGLIAAANLPIRRATDQKKSKCTLKVEEDIPETSNVMSVNKQKQTLALKPDVILLTEQDEVFRIIIDSDEETDGGFSCLLKENQTCREVHWLEEAQEETMRILKKARRRKRKFSKDFILI